MKFLNLKIFGLIILVNFRKISRVMKFIKIITLSSLFWASMGFGVSGIGDDNTPPEEEKKYIEEPEDEQRDDGQRNETPSEATSKQDDSASPERTKNNIKALEATINKLNGKITSREHSLKNLNNALDGLPGSRQSLMQRLSELERTLKMNEVNLRPVNAGSIIDRLNRIEARINELNQNAESINQLATLIEMFPSLQPKQNSARQSKKIDRDQLEREIQVIREEANAIRQQNENLDALERDAPNEIHQIEQELATLTLQRGITERLLAQLREELKKTSPKQTTAITSTTDTCAAVCPELTPEEREALRQQQLKDAKDAYLARHTARPKNQANSTNGVLPDIDPINSALILILMLLLASYGFL